MTLDPIDLWSGDFGDAYIERNSSSDAQAASLRLMVDALGGQSITDVLELGANIGLNLRSLRLLFPSSSQSAVEVNPRACERLRRDGVHVIEGSLLDVEIARRFDLVMTVGVLIHIEPRRLQDAYHQIYQSAERLILIAEYYSAHPVAVSYRGIDGAMWKRDFAGELLDLYPDLQLIGFGATYHRWAAGDDDLAWFLLKKG